MIMNEIIIRPARVQDLDEINRIIEAAMMTWDLPERVKRLTIPSYQYTEQDLQHMHIVVAEREQQLAGVAAWEQSKVKFEDGQQAVLLLHGVYVDPQQHRSGIGASLFAAAQQAAKTKGLNGILVKAQKGSEGFYTAMGMHTLAVSDIQRDFENRFYKPL